MTEQEEGGLKISMDEVYFVLFRQKWKILAGLTAGIAAAAFLYVTTPSVYRSDAKLLVRYVTDRTALEAENTGDRVTSPDRYGANIINSEIEIIASRDSIEKVVDEIGEEQFFSDSTNANARIRAIISILNNLKIEAPARSNIIRLYYDGTDPVIAQRVLSKLIDIYLQKHIEIHREVGAYDFLSQQTDQLRTRLTQTEEELRKLKSDAGVTSLDESKAAIALRTEELERTLRELEGTRAAEQAKLGVLRGSLPAAGDATNSGSEAFAGMELTGGVYDRLQQLRERKISLLSTFREDSAPVQDIMNEIATLEGLAGTGTAARAGAELGYAPPGELRTSLVAEEAGMAATEAKIQIINGQIEDTRRAAAKINEMESRIVQLERMKELQEANYRYFSKSLEQARIDDALDSGKISNINIVEPATLPIGARCPDLPRNMGIALGIGIFAGLGGALLREKVLDHSVRRPKEVAALLKCKLLISLPLVKEKRRRAGADGDDSSGGGPAGADKLARMPRGREQLDEYYDTLRDRLLADMDRGEKKTRLIGVTGCSRGAGVTTVAAGLAMAIARHADERVLLVDANPSNQLAHRVFGVNPSGAFTDIVPDGKGNTAVVERNLYLLNATPAKEEVRLTLARRFNNFLEAARTGENDFVVLDLPPVTETSPTLRLSRMLDAVILVIEAERVGRDLAVRAEDLLSSAGAPMIGAVLNKRRFYIPGWLHKEL